MEKHVEAYLHEGHNPLLATGTNVLLSAYKSSSLEIHTRTKSGISLEYNLIFFHL